MGITIAILITLAMAGSVLWVMPSPREKALTEMRASAMANGTKVRLLDKRLQSTLFPWLEDHRDFVLYEKLFLSGRKPTLVQPYIYRLKGRQDAEEELLSDQHRQISNFLNSNLNESVLPETAEAIVASSLGVAILWREKGGVEQVEAIDEVLQMLHGAAQQLH